VSRIGTNRAEYGKTLGSTLEWDMPFLRCRLPLIASAGLAALACTSCLDIGGRPSIQGPESGIEVLDSAEGADSAGPGEPVVDSVDTQEGIHLVGRVLDGLGRPILNGIAILEGYGLSDTTDSEGLYEIILPVELGLPPVKRASEVLDHLSIRMGSRVVTELDVSQYRDTLPDIRIIRRTIRGSLFRRPPGLGWLEAEIRSSGDTGTGTLLRMELEDTRFSGSAF
jgi:hypothetical protein